MEKKKYSIPIYLDGELTEFTVDFEEGDEKEQQIRDFGNGKIPYVIYMQSEVTPTSNNN
jgi:hypothetical protein